jgi:hypothetical protein
MRIRDQIAKWPMERVNIVLAQWDDFERDGAIGDCDLRRAAQDMNPSATSGVTTMMRDIAFECYRRKAKQTA